MNTYYIWTVGCQVNVADSGKLAAGLRRLGWEATDQPEDADFIVLNTCAVRQQAEDKAAHKLDALQHLKAVNPNLKIAVMGCTVGPRTGQLEERFPFVDVFAQPQRFDDVIFRARSARRRHRGRVLARGLSRRDTRRSHMCRWSRAATSSAPTASCRYDAAVNAAGRSMRSVAKYRRTSSGAFARSRCWGKQWRPMARTRSLSRQALSTRTSPDLMRAIHDLDGLGRIRQLTSYPPDMTDRILSGMAELPKVCESFSLPVQSGDDEILASMKRGYSVAEFVERVEKVRSLMPDVGISTDLIVGFPGETHEHFMNSYRLLEELRFDKVHVAAYSPRAGTFADRKQPDNVPQAEKMERLHAVEELQKSIAFAINHELWGRTLPIMVEDCKPSREAGVDRVTGRTRCAKLVHLDTPSGGLPQGRRGRRPDHEHLSLVAARRSHRQPR